MEPEKKKITIADVAKELGVSKTTVSRSISGKGRIGEATKKRVLSYIEEHGYQPNQVAKGLAQSKTFNICVACPSDYHAGDLLFFQKCLMGITERAARKEYDIVIAMVDNQDITQLQRIMRNHKADGVILMRTRVEDVAITYLQQSQIPFVAIGSAPDGVIQVDNDNRVACKNMTELLIEQGMERIALVGGNTSHTITRSRYAGFQDGYEAKGCSMDMNLVFLDVEEKEELSEAVDKALAQKPDCILCMDDAVCVKVLAKFREEGITIPKTVKIASFYHCTEMDYNDPQITSLKFDATLLGETACDCLLAHLQEDMPLEGRVIHDYELIEKNSTKG